MENDMEKLVKEIENHYTKTFKSHGPTSKGVDWGAMEDVEFRYRKMMEILNRDYEKPEGVPTVLDAGCGWGGLLAYCRKNGIEVDYTGIDIVKEMIDYAKAAHDVGKFIHGDILRFNPKQKYDYVVGSGVLSLKLNNSIPQTENYVRTTVQKMFSLCRYGTAFNLMSNRVNFMVDNLYYTSPVEFLNFCLQDISSRVKLDHGYSCLNRGSGKLFEYTVYLYRD
jgi:hypothetical protein